VFQSGEERLGRGVVETRPGPAHRLPNAELVTEQGNPEAIEENIRVLRGRGDGTERAAEGLRAIDTGSWDGPAAREFHTKFSYEPNKWFDASDALHRGASLLEDYATTLRWAQGRAGEAIALWDKGQAATQ
jgi:hypothetical protein